VNTLWFIFRCLALWAAVIFLPLGTGRLFFHRNEFKNGMVYLFGMCASLSFFELLYLPFFFLGLSFSLLTAVYFVITVLASMYGFVLGAKNKAAPAPPREPLEKGEKIALAVAAAVVLFQILRVTFGAGTWNVDDAWYLSIANTAVDTDTIMRYDAITGLPFDYTEHVAENFEYVFCPWPLFWAMFSRLYQIHITILMRTVLPWLFILIFYYVLWLLLEFIFKDDRKKAIFALCFASVFLELVSVAMNLKTTWILCYPWMGKGFGPSVLCAVSLYFFLCTEDETRPLQRRSLWIGIFLANTAGCMVASSCAELDLIILGCWGLVYVIRTKKFSVIWKLALSVIPCLFLMAGHLILG
jgi:hypothetical protein